MLSLLFGLSNTGKSHITEHLLACAITGHPPPGEGRVARDAVQAIYMTSEDDREQVSTPRIRTMVQRMLADMGQDADLAAVDVAMERLHWLGSVKQGDDKKGFSLQADVDALEDFIAVRNMRMAACPVGFVAISPLTAYSGVHDSNDANQTRQVLTPLKEMAERQFVVCWLLSHPRKDSAEHDSSVADMHAGTQAVFAQMRIVAFTVQCPEPEPDGNPSLWTLLLREKRNVLGKNVPFGFRYQIVDATFRGMILPPRGTVPKEGEKPTSVVKWGDRYDRTPDDVMRELRRQAREQNDAEKDKGGRTGDAKCLMLTSLLRVPGHR